MFLIIARSALVFLLNFGFPVAGHAAGEILAEVDEVPITSEEVEKTLASHLSKLEEQIYNLKRRHVEALINEKLLAKEAAKRGVSVSALLDAEVTSKTGPVTEQEIEEFYQANQAQLKGEESNLREQIRAHLQNQKLSAKRQEFLESLRSRAKVRVHLQPPPIYRVDVSTAGAPFRGAPDAPVTIVEFSEFQCPFCSRVQATLKQLLERYPDKVKLVYRDFPLDGLHPNARLAAEAARCAQDQGKFWEYHDALFSHFPQAAPEDLKEYAAQIGLDTVKFDSCLSGRIHKATVQRDIDEGMRLGVTGTPAFFVNGRPLSGAQPVNAFVKLIDDELKLLGAAPGEK
ncbi:MAG TPA: thioredoxin domain-containing protein [Candidatus Eisenbacteria bacterium]|nr:thioredoxin domain-containing protein [Candidatus Eisenbacteria bacterium]